MMTAKEAKEKAEQAHLDINNATLKNELPNIEAMLNLNIAKGSRIFFVRTTKVSSITKLHLESLGYKLTMHHGSYDDPSEYKIEY